jgi:hypothetical protein
MHTELWPQNPKGGDHLEDLGIDGRTWHWILDLGRDDVGWIHLAQDIAGACEQSNDRFSFVKRLKFLRYLSDHKLLTNNILLWWQTKNDSLKTLKLSHPRIPSSWTGTFRVEGCVFFAWRWRLQAWKMAPYLSILFTNNRESLRNTVCLQSPFGVLKNYGAQINWASDMRFAPDHSETLEAFLLI